MKKKICMNCLNAHSNYINKVRIYFCRLKLNERGNPMKVDEQGTCNKFEKSLPQPKPAPRRKATENRVTHISPTRIII